MLTHSTPDQLPPFAVGPLFGMLRDLNRISGPIHSPLLADLLGISERTARHYLYRMEQSGLVRRPAGPRSGWIAGRHAPAQTPKRPDPVESPELITRAEAARRLGVNRETITRWVKAGHFQLQCQPGDTSPLIVASSLHRPAYKPGRKPGTNRQN